MAEDPIDLKKEILENLRLRHRYLLDAYDCTESPLYDDGATFWDIQDLENLIERVENVKFFEST